MRLKTTAALAVGLLALVAAAPGSGADAKARPEPRWALTWEAALQEAKERNVPIYLAYHQDG